VCNATELEVDRAQFGGSSIGGCSCKFARPDLATNPSFRLDKRRFACQLNLFDRGTIEGSLLYRTEGTSEASQLQCRSVQTSTRLLS
jgi:hypothetical protein